ncbi:hypothetical protein [Cerasicoccus maritimus]|uniref:hypothetical protein n=1 Tax=Cerasicoccus maritimus TaxID=490089 RepID=UPI0028529622|nr:hypothetical protein [Cerasicoccus maritimus]
MNPPISYLIVVYKKAKLLLPAISYFARICSYYTMNLLRTFVTLLVPVHFFVCATLSAQGELTPPGAPGPTQKSVQQIWDQVESIRTAVEASEAQQLGEEPEGGDLVPTSPPAATMKSLQDIWDELQMLKTSINNADSDEDESLGVVVTTGNDLYSGSTAKYVQLGLFPEFDPGSLTYPVLGGGPQDFVTAITGDTGVAEFPPVPPGMYSIRSLDSYYTQLVTPVFEVVEGLNSPNVINLNRALVQRAFRIIDASTDLPVSGATITVKRNATEVANGLTDDRGEVSFSNLPLLIEGDVSLVVSATKTNYALSSRVFRPSPSNPPVTLIYMLPIDRTMPQVLDGRVVGDDRGDAIASIRGHVYSYENSLGDGDPEGLQGVRVSLDDASIEPVHTDSEGYYYFSNLENARVYTVTAERAGFITESGEVRAVAGSNRELDLYPFSNIKVSMAFPSADIAEVAEVTLWTTPSSRRFVARSAPGDNMNILDGNNFTVGSYLVYISSPGFRASNPVVFEVTQASDGRLSFDPFESFQLSISRLYLGGTVFDAETGEPIAGVSVTTEPETLALTTDASGQFHIVGGAEVEPGTTKNLLDNRTYTFSLSKDGYEPVDGVEVLLSPKTSSRHAITIPEGAPNGGLGAFGINDIEIQMTPQ